MPRGPEIRTLCRWSWLIAMVLCAAQAGAQLTIGENLKMNLSGSMGFGYNGAFGNTFQSGHGQSFVSDASLTGSYYHPNFLSFTFHPFYARSQNNSLSGVITHENGLEGSVALFGGSHFPGSVSYGRSFGSSSEYGIPGIGGIFGDGSGQSFQISWAELVPGLPPVYANFGVNSSSYSVLGSTENNDSSSKFFTLNSNYTLRGFQLAGNFSHLTSSFSSPSFLDVRGLSGGGSSTSFGVSASHQLPLRGSFGVGYSHSSYGDEAGTSHGSTSNLNGGVSFQPLRTLSISTNGSYTGNLSAALLQTVDPGTGMLLNIPELNSRSLRLGSNATLSLGHGLTINGYASIANVSFLRSDYTNTQYGGNLSYRFTHRLLGMLHFSFGLVDNANKQGNAGLSLLSNVGMSRRFGRWETSADFGYSQTVQTLAEIDTTSSLSYGASVRRKISSETYWSGSFRASHSALVQRAGTSNGTEGISSNLTWRRYGVGAGYGQARGTSVVSTSGVLVPTPLAVLVTNDVILFNARSLSVSGTTKLRRGLIVTANYSTARSDSLAQAVNSFTETRIYNATAEYKVRKLSFTGGFRRVSQEISISSSVPVVVNSYYIRITRWFNVF